MKKLLKAIVWILAVLVVIFIGGGYLLPNEVNLQRQTVKRAAGKGFCAGERIQAFQCMVALGGA